MKPCLTVYKASAGSGKTFTLAIQYIKLLIISDNPNAYSNILAVTFTNKATAEMKERIIEQLYGIWKALPSSDNYLQILQKELKDYGCEMNSDIIRERAGKALMCILHDYNRFRVETIDSFFQTILKNLAHELNLVANFKVDLNDKEVLNESVDRIIDRLHLTPDIMNLIMDYVNDRITNNQTWDISNEVKGFGACIFKQEYLSNEDTLKEVLTDSHKIRTIREEFERQKQAASDYQKSAVEHYNEELHAYGIDNKIFSFGNDINSYLKKLEDIENEIKFGNRLQGFVNDYENMLKSADKKDPQMISLAKHFSQLLGEVRQVQLVARQLYSTSMLALKHLNPLRLLGVINKEVTQLNTEKNRFLLAKTPLLLNELVDDSDAPFIYEKIGAHLNHIMIDEFQDTSWQQWNNFKVLLKEGMSKGHENLIVGDIKQSIYRWRDGDWSILNNIGTEFKSYNPEIKSLTHNFRSERRIINFNNALFKKAASALDKLGNDAETSISNAYNDVEQQSPSLKSEQGCVEINFNKMTGRSRDPEGEMLMLDEMCLKIKELHQQGVEYHDMAIILREKKLSQQIIEAMESKIPDANPVSDEAFLLKSSLSVNLIINVLRFLNNTDERIAINFLTFYYNSLIKQNSFGMNDLAIQKKELNNYLPKELTDRQEELRQLPLYELNEEIYRIFELEQIHEEDAYLFTYFDNLINYLHDNPADLNSFLKYWEDILSVKSIPSGTIGGIRILTIHKSKGLQFHTVFMPYCDWKVEAEKNSNGPNNLLWCKPETAPYNKLPIIPITPGNAMAESIFKKEYEEEHLQRRIENLNLLYVAFTRSEKNLYVWADTRYVINSSEYTVGDLLYTNLPNELSGVNITTDNEGKIKTFQYGSAVFAKEKSEEKNNNRLKIKYTPKECRMHSYNARIDFCQSLKAEEFIESMANNEEKDAHTNDKRRMGIQLHYIFSQIHTHDDIDKVLTQLDIDGKISSQYEKEELANMVRIAINDTRVNHWFDGSMKLYNECPILSKQYNKESGKYQIYRPDRVMIGKDCIYIADFKFGEPRKEYKNQIKEYMNQLQLMEPEKTVKGYLWYITTNKIEEV